VPVIWVYLTGWANGDGIVSFRDDVYGIDSIGDATANAAPAAAAPTPVNAIATPVR
jgi:L,D-transpeptidase YcbB